MSVGGDHSKKAIKRCRKTARLSHLGCYIFTQTSVDLKFMGFWVKSFFKYIYIYVYMYTDTFFTFNSHTQGFHVRFRRCIECVGEPVASPQAADF